MAKKGTEIGSTGLVEFSGIIADDFLRELRGKEGYKKYDEMRRNSSIIAAMLLANEQALRKVSWEFTADDENDPRLELLNDARDNMTLSWNDHIIEALTMLPFGFSVFECVYERDERNRWLWRKFAPRGQDTIYQWKFDDTGGVAGITQMAAPRYENIFIPIDKLLIYRTRVERGNPEGRSILRAAWIPYYYAKHLQQIEAIGVERDLAGLPVITLPQGADVSETDNSDLGKAQTVVRNIRNDEQAGLTLPFGWVFELASTGGSRAFDTDKIIKRYESRMLMSALAQFLMLGQEQVGSLALSKDQTDFFTMSVNAIADIIAETFTKYAIPRLLKLNGYDTEGVWLEHTPAGDTDVTLLADMLQKIGGLVTWDAGDELWLRQTIGLPERDVETLQAERDAQAAAKAEAARAFAQKVGGGEDKGKPAARLPQRGQEKEADAEKDENTISVYAADPPDKKKRARFEREWDKAMQTFFEQQKRRVLREARKMKP